MALWLFAQGLAAAGCTLTADDYEPAQVAAQHASGVGVDRADPVDPVESLDGAGSSLTEAPAPAVCASGQCTASCDGGCAPRCGSSQACSVGSDCPSLDCVAGCCAPPSCHDAIANQGEADVDCGGPCQARCRVDQRCQADVDCAEGLSCGVETRHCSTPSCQDGRRGGAEILVDCGGGECPGCPDGTSCTRARDCASGSCDASSHCASPSCTDGIANQDETALDCGGSCAQRCSLGATCNIDADCASGSCGAACASGSGRCCQLPPCSDGLKDDRETDVDCGGPSASCERCGEGQGCVVDGDCASGACEQGSCCGGTTANCTRCAERLSATQNCSGAPQGGLTNCTAFLDCLTRNAQVCSTRFAPGCTNDPGGVCNHNTYGGNDGLGLRQATLVLQEAGCSPQ